MKIRDIIVEINSENVAKLNKLRDLGKTELARRIYFYLGKVDDWDAAAEAARDDMDAGKPMPNVQKGNDSEIFRVDVSKNKKDNTVKSPVDISRSAGWDDETHGHLRRTGDGKGTVAKIAKAIDPTSDLDNTDIGTTFTSALAKAKGRATNFGQFKIQKKS